MPTSAAVLRMVRRRGRSHGHAADGVDGLFHVSIRHPDTPDASSGGRGGGASLQVEDLDLLLVREVEEAPCDVIHRVFRLLVLQ